MYITNNTEIALLAEECGVDRIFVDLEFDGKYERQNHLDSVISKHEIIDVYNIKKQLTKSKLLVRVNPMKNNSKSEIDEVIKYGADIVMLPMFKTSEEVERFISYVNGRAKVNILLETGAALCRIDEILNIEGIDEIHIGLNDLNISLGTTFMFEALSGGLIEYLCKKISAKGIRYGFGGIARVGYGLLPAEHIIMEHYRLGSQMAILSRSFCDANKVDIDSIRETFQLGVHKIRDFESSLSSAKIEDYERNRILVKEKVAQIVNKIKSKEVIL
jgi:2-keto-3-deoxy-L-rhamnonate aldolase RhmA